MRRKLLTAMALCSATISTMPLWAVQEWEDPTLPTVAIDLDSEGIYYVYHPATKLFMANGNAQNIWGTEVILSEEGQRVRIRPAVDGRQSETVTGWTMEMLDAVANNGGKPKYLWTNGTILCVDYNLQTEGSYVWQIIKNDDADTYRIHIPAEDPRYGEAAQDGLYANSYMGWDGVRNDDGTVAKKWVMPFINKDNEGYGDAELDWAFVTEDDYKEYEAKMELRIALEYAVSKGYPDYAEYETIYNGNATVEDVKAAAEALTKKVDQFLIDNASEENPFDMTNHISSPSFDDGTVGWTVSRDTQNGQDNFGVQSASQATVDGTEFRNFFERWVAQPPQSDWSILQEVKDLPKGKYKLSAYVLVNNNAPKGAYLVVNGGSGEERQAVNQPGEINGKFTAIPYEVEFTVLDGSAIIGLRVIDANFQWLGIDNFKLVYCGKSDAKEELQKVINEAEAYLAQVENDGMKYNYAKRDQFMAAIKFAKEALVNEQLDDDRLNEIQMNMVLSMEDFKRDVQAYSELIPIINDKLYDLIYDYEPYAELKNNNPEAFVNILSYTRNLEDTYNSGTFDSSEIIEVGPKMDEMFRKDIFEMLNTGLTNDLYGILQSPDFDNKSAGGWNGSPAIGNGVAEKYFGSAGAQSFDVYQEIEDIPNGVYIVSMQGFSRPGNNDELQAGWDDGITNTVYAQLYGNENTVALHHLYDGGRTEPYVFKNDGTTDDKQIAVIDNKYVVNNLTSAAIAFEAGEYKNEVHCVVFDGKLRFGVKMNAELGLKGSWTTFDNFRVNYVGEATAADYVASVQLLYDEVNALYSAIISYDKAATADVVEQLGGLLTKASAFISSPTTTDEAEALIVEMKEAIEYANTSVKRTAELYAWINDMYYDRGPNYEQEGIDIYQVYSLCDEIDALLPTNKIESVEKVDQYIVELNSLLTKVVQDVVCAGATQDDPKDLTLLVMNPGFSLTDPESGLTSDSSDGWTFSYDDGSMAFRVSTGEFYNNQSFDIHQTLYGLAPGFYRLSCNAFYRDGDYRTAAGKHRRGEENLNAILYAGIEDSRTYTLIKSIIEDGQPEPISSQNVNVADSLTTEENPIEAWYIPNAMEDAVYAFGLDLYHNELQFEIKEGDKKINIGICKEQQTESNDWVTFDNFQLFYYGNGSEDNPTGIQNIGNNPIKIIHTTYYTIDGVRIAKPIQSGLYIRKDEFADGTVQTSKIIIK